MKYSRIFLGLAGTFAMTESVRHNLVKADKCIVFLENSFEMSESMEKYYKNALIKHTIQSLQQYKSGISLRLLLPYTLRTPYEMVCDIEALAYHLNKTGGR